MRFDPQANFVQSDARFASGETAAVPLGSPLKAALVIVVIGLLGGGGLWVWNEGIPGLPTAAAETSGGHVDASVVEYAEAVISAKNSTEVAEALTGSSMGDPRYLTRRSSAGRFREEFEAGKRYMAMGRHADALPHLAEAVRLEPGMAEAHYRLGLAYVHTGRPQAALQEQITLQQLDPDLANLLAHLINN